MSQQQQHGAATRSSVGGTHWSALRETAHSRGAAGTAAASPHLRQYPPDRMQHLQQPPGALFVGEPQQRQGSIRTHYGAAAATSTSGGGVERNNTSWRSDESQAALLARLAASRRGSSSSSSRKASRNSAVAGGGSGGSTCLDCSFSGQREETPTPQRGTAHDTPPGPTVRGGGSSSSSSHSRGDAGPRAPLLSSNLPRTHQMASSPIRQPHQQQGPGSSVAAMGSLVNRWVHPSQEVSPHGAGHMGRAHGQST